MEKQDFRFETNPRKYPNTCGECSACCYAPGIPEYGKEAFVSCEHLPSWPDVEPWKRGGNCDIYTNKCERCNLYACAWLQGVISGGSENRPDEIGLMFDTVFFFAREVWPGALNEDKAAALLASMNDNAKGVFWVPITVCAAMEEREKRKCR